jgi:riboflavin-specific deaminase-like protein
LVLVVARAATLRRVQLRRLHSEPSELTPQEATAGLRLGERAPGDRPYLALNMVATADGWASIGGRTRALGGEADQAIFHGLRTQVDAVLVGAGTATVENYGRLVKSDELREQRAADGLAATPLACVVSGDLSLPGQIPLLQDPDSHVVVATCSDGEIAGAKARVEYLRMDDRDLAPVMERLRRDYDVRSLLCEGGPTLNRSLLAGGLVDELFLTLSPQLGGGTPELTIVEGLGLPEPIDLRLVSTIAAGDWLFLRYALRVAGTSTTGKEGL